MGHDSYYEQLEKLLDRVVHHGHYFSAICPLHGDTSPSLLVYPTSFICMGCRRTGSLLKLLKTMQRQRGYRKSHTIQQLEPLTPFASPTIDLEELSLLAHDTLTAFPNQAEYLRTRRIDGRIEACRIGWYDGWYTFPVYSDTDDFKGLVARAGPELQKRTGWRYVAKQSPLLYVPDWAKVKNSLKLYVVFGIIDALALSELRLPVVTSTHGQDFDPQWLNRFRVPCYFIPDKGEEEAARKIVAQLGWRGKLLNINWPEGCKDPADTVERHKEQLLLAQL